MVEKNALQQVVALDKFSTLTEEEMMMVEGGIHVGHVIKAVGIAYSAGYAFGSFIGNIFK